MTVPVKNCIRKVVKIVEWWGSFHNHIENQEEVNMKLASLVDLKPMLKGKVTEEAQLENLKSLMRQTSEVKRRKTEGECYGWEVDYNFYVDQFKV